MERRPDHMHRFFEATRKTLGDDEQIGDRSAFGLLPSHGNRRRSFAISTVTNIVAMVLFLVLSLTHLPRVKPVPTEVTALTFEAPKVQVSHVRIVAPSPKLMARLTTAQRIPSPPSTVAAIRSVKVGTFSSVRSTVLANIHRPATVKVGAFGNPMGARVNPTARVATLRAPVLGTFGGVPGGLNKGAGAPRHGNGAGGGGGVHLAGFGTGAGGVGGSAPSQTDTQPVTVTHSVMPVYTAEAHSAGVQGEVILRVRFAANGQVEILSVIQSLGHGLVESAENAVRQYRFMPAMRNGRPVDQTTTVHVRFQLAA